MLKRFMTIRSPYVLMAILLVASAAILAPKWGRSPSKLRLQTLDKFEMSNKQFLGPTLVNPIEIPTHIDSPTDHSQPIGVSKKNSWNPSPSWRTDAGWPTNQQRTELRPITIEKIPEAYPLTVREKSLPPIARDSVQQGNRTGSVTISKAPAAAPSVGVVPWSSLVDDSELAARKAIQSRVTGLSEKAPNVGLGKTVSLGQELDNETINPPGVPSKVPQNEPTLSPIDSQRFIRQPSTRR